MFYRPNISQLKCMPRFLADFLEKDRISSHLLKKNLSVEASGRLAQHYVEIATELGRLGWARRTGAKAIWVPGRIEVLGKHTDYAGGASLLATVERGFSVIVLPWEKREVVVLDVASGEMVYMDKCGRVKKDAPAWSIYPQATMQRLVGNFGLMGKGGIIAFKSDLPVASGMSSSSAFIIAIYYALQFLSDFSASNLYRSSINGPTQLADYMGHIENGQTYGALEGDRGVGTFGGSQDHAAILCAQARHVLHVTFDPTELKAHLPIHEDLVFCIGSSGVKAEKTAGAQKLYNQAAIRAKKVTDFWNQGYDASLDSLAKIIQAPSFNRDTFLDQLQPQSDLHDRFMQFYNETTIYIPKAIRALEQHDYVAFGEVVKASQSDAEMKLKNQIPETIFLAQSARASGAYAASAFGAGFGGAVWALVPRGHADKILENWSRAYAKAYPQHQDASFFIDETGPAAFIF